MQNTEQASQGFIKTTLSKLHIGSLDEVAGNILDYSGKVAIAAGLFGITGNIVLNNPWIIDHVLSTQPKLTLKVLDDFFRQDIFNFQKIAFSAYIANFINKLRSQDLIDIPKSQKHTLIQVILLQASEIAFCLMNQK